MKKWYFNNLFYSNCLITAIIIKIRYGGKLVLNRAKGTLYFHVKVDKGKYLLDMTPVHPPFSNKEWYKKMWFYGCLRLRRKPEHFQRIRDLRDH